MVSGSLLFTGDSELGFGVGRRDGIMSKGRHRVAIGLVIHLSHLLNLGVGGMRR